LLAFRRERSAPHIEAAVRRRTQPGRQIIPPACAGGYRGALNHPPTYVGGYEFGSGVAAAVRRRIQPSGQIMLPAHAAAYAFFRRLTSAATLTATLA